MKHIAITFKEFGKATEVLRCESADAKLDGLKPGEIRVQIQFAPINPADYNFIFGNYGIRPELPATPGIEGCGIVIESHSDSVKIGDLVIFTERVGTWQNLVTTESDNVFVIPSELKFELQQAAILKVNPLTALRILRDFVDLKPGDYVIQNAANSGVGKCLIQIAKILGFKTINVVRREGLEESLKALGADHVLLDNSELTEKVKEICGDNLPKLASNAVGGDSALRLMDALADQGTHVTYGAMSMRSLKVPNKFLIFKRIHLQGLWVTKWLAENNKQDIHAAYTELCQWIAAGKLKQPVQTLCPPEEILKAVELASQAKREGKTLLDFRKF